MSSTHPTVDPVASDGPEAELDHAWALHTIQPAAALEFARRCRDKAPDDPWVAGKVALIEGWMALRLDRLDEAMAYALRAQEQLTLVTDVWAGRAMLLMGNVCSEFGLRFQATSSLSAGDLIAQSLGDQQLRAQAALGLAHEQIGHPARLEQFQAAYDMFAELDDAEGMVLAGLNIAQEHIGLGDDLAAAAAMDEAFRHPEIEQMEPSYTFALSVSAACDARLGRSEQARRQIEEVTARCALLDSPNCDAELSLAQACTALGDIDLAIRRLHELRDGGNCTPAQRVKLALELATTYESAGEIGQAYHWLREHVRLNAEHQDVQARERGQALAVIHRTRETESRLTAIQEQHRLLRERSQRDALTGLFNREFLMDYLTDLCAEPATHALLMIDVDRFKQINDNFGHLAGDEMLESVARQVVAVVGEGGVVARYAGDEFAAVLSGADADSAVPLAAGLVEQMQTGAAIERAGQQIHATISVGVATQQGPIDPKVFLQHADDALYRAKAAGRNRFALHCSAEDEPSPAPESASVAERTANSASVQP